MDERSSLPGLSVYEIVVQEMAERTLRGEVAELGRHILQKWVFFQLLSPMYMCAALILFLFVGFAFE